MTIESTHNTVSQPESRNYEVWGVGFGILGPVAGLHPETYLCYRSVPPQLVPSQTVSSWLVPQRLASGVATLSKRVDTSSSQCLAPNDPRSVGRNPASPYRAAVWPAVTDIPKYTFPPLYLPDTMKSRMRAAALLSTAAALMAASPKASQAQADSLRRAAWNAHVDSLRQAAARARRLKLFVSVIAWRGDTLIIKASLPSLSSSVDKAADFGGEQFAVSVDVELTNLASVTRPQGQELQSSQIPVILESGPGAPTVMLGRDVVTTNSFMLDVSPQVNLEMYNVLAAKQRLGVDAPNGVLTFNH